ncbi:hypothetical protein QL285_039975 [Trifolium repens]|nr:hypothetical protein QL285_039975 [Trifolium repens]
MPKTINNHMLYFNIKGNNGAMRVWEWGLTSLLPNKIEIGLHPLPPLTPKRLQFPSQPTCIWLKAHIISLSILNNNVRVPFHMLPLCRP